MQIIYIYNKNLEIIGQPWCKDLETFNQNPIKYCPTWTSDCYASTTKFNYPKWDNGKVREKTREEICADGDLSVLTDGEVYQDGVIKTISIPDDLFSPKWEYPNWVEGATLEEMELAYKTKINDLKAETLEEGFKFIKDGEHQQKNRDKDRTLLTSSMSSMKRQGKDKIEWSFNDGDIVELTLEEMQRMEDEGFVITQAVFAIEAQLKSQSPTNNLTLEKFKDMVDAISTIKCWRTETKSTPRTFSFDDVDKLNDTLKNL